MADCDDLQVEGIDSDSGSGYRDGRSWRRVCSYLLFNPRANCHNNSASATEFFEVNFHLAKVRNGTQTSVAHQLSSNQVIFSGWYP